MEYYNRHFMVSTESEVVSVHYFHMLTWSISGSHGWSCASESRLCTFAYLKHCFFLLNCRLTDLIFWWL